jgi:4-alpha-glucanotransferase
MHIGQFTLGERADEALPTGGEDELFALNTHDMPTFCAHVRGDDIRRFARLGLIDDDEVEPQIGERLERMRRVVRFLVDEGSLDHAEREDPAAVLRAVLARAAAGAAEVVLVNLEDLWLEPDPQNVPGVVEGYPSWRRKAAKSLEQIETGKSIAEVVRGLARDRS